jgi:hypothetical protein
MLNICDGMTRWQTVLPNRKEFIEKEIRTDTIFYLLQNSISPAIF